MGGSAYFDLIGTRTECDIPWDVPWEDRQEINWFSDELPEGAEAVEPWQWTDERYADGQQSHVQTAVNFEQHSFRNATDTLDPKPGDIIRTWVLLDPCNPPRQIMLRFREGSNWKYAAYWGENLIGVGTDGTSSRVRIGPLPRAGQWARLDVPAALLGMQNSTIGGMAFAQWNGRVWYDRVAVVSQVNVASGKTATQSSTSSANNAAARAVDGDVNGDNTVSPAAITAAQSQPWWQVDLSASQPIDRIDLWNRTDAAPEQLSNFWIFVSDEPFTSGSLAATQAQAGVSAYHQVPAVEERQSVLIDRPGRYVRVQLEGTAQLQLAEVQIWAPVVEELVNVASGAQSVTQESTAAGGTEAELAVNGTVNPVKALGETIAETAASDEAWWEIDLGARQTLTSIDLWGRADCCALSGFWVFVSDEPFSAQTVAGTLAQPGVSAWYQGTLSSIAYRFPVYREGRYVRIQRAGSGALNLAEVQIWGASPMWPLLRSGGPTR
jgi:hypothetical protein